MNGNANRVLDGKHNLIGRELRHFKGGHYRLEGFAKAFSCGKELLR